MIIKVHSDMPCGVFVDGKQYVTPFELTTKTSECGQLTVLPSSPERYSGYTLTYKVEEDVLKSLSGGASGISWGAGLGEIKLTPIKSEKRFTPEVIAQRKSGGSQVTLYTDGAYRLMCEGASFYACDLPDGFEGGSLKLSKDGRMVAVEGKVGEKKYLLALSLSQDNEWQTMHELVADEIETSEVGVSARDVLPSMLRHEKKCVYKPFSSAPIEEQFTPTIRHEYVSALIPYLFLECIVMKNPDADSMIDGSLSIDAKGVREFLGDFDCIVYPPFSEYGNDVVAIFNSKERIAKPDIYKFEVQNSKITNIIHLLTCY